jgi:CHASE2 domain-containing sensor protein
MPPHSKKLWSRVSTVGVLVLVTLSGFFFEEFKAWFPWLTSWQLHSYNWVSHLEARKPRPKFVMGIEIDDQTFYRTMHLAAGDVTDRRSLGEIIRRIAQFHPAVIAVDIDFRWEPADDSEPRKSANEALLSAIRDVEAQHIPVVLTCGFDRGNSAGREYRNIFPDASLPDFGKPNIPYRARIGFFNAAEDLRKVPLSVERYSPEGQLRPYNSFALAVAEAYEDVLGIHPKTSERLEKQISRGEFVYTSFLPQEECFHKSANALLQQTDGDLEQINHHVALIGLNRHTFPEDGDDYVDDHQLIPLRMRGMYFQANYIEGLLDDRIKATVPRWEASIIDLAIAILMIRFSIRRHSLSARLGLLSVYFIPVALAYIAAVNLGYVLDFVLPLLLLFLHAFVEHYIHLWHSATALKGV